LQSSSLSLSLPSSSSSSSSLSQVAPEATDIHLCMKQRLLADIMSSEGMDTAQCRVEGTLIFIRWARVQRRCGLCRHELLMAPPPASFARKNTFLGQQFPRNYEYGSSHRCAKASCTCPCGTALGLATMYWEATATLDDGTAQSFLYTERDATLQLLRLAGSDQERLEKLALACGGELVYRRGVVPVALPAAGGRAAVLGGRAAAALQSTMPWSAATFGGVAGSGAGIGAAAVNGGNHTFLAVSPEQTFANTVADPEVLRPITAVVRRFYAKGDRNEGGSASFSSSSASSSLPSSSRPTAPGGGGQGPGGHGSASFRMAKIKVNGQYANTWCRPVLRLRAYRIVDTDVRTRLHMMLARAGAGDA
jgi:hypothetical protein